MRGGEKVMQIKYLLEEAGGRLPVVVSRKRGSVCLYTVEIASSFTAEYRNKIDRKTKQRLPR